MFPYRPTASRPAPWSVSVPLLVLLVLLGAAPAQADTDDPVDGRVGAAEYYAGLLAEEPEGEVVFVDDSLSGLYDLDGLEAELHGVFAPLDVPYYVVASDLPLPEHGIAPRHFLAAVQDRLGEPGLYVYLRPAETEVTAVARDVNLPVDRANSVLLRERELTSLMPLADKADLFAQTLVAPDLDRRYEEGWGLGPEVLGPAYWWADSYLRELRLETHNGPERLGETAAFAVGLTAALALAFGTIRSGRRKRAPAVGRAGRVPGDRALVTGAVLATATGAVVMAASLVHLNTATLREDVEHVGPLPPETPPYVADTTRVERVAEALSEDPLYVDPLAQADTRGLAEIGERELPEDLPVYVAVLPMGHHHEAGRDGEIFAHALHHVMGEDGVFVVVQNRPGSGTTQVDTARFGLAFEDGGRYSTRLREATGHLEGATPAHALDELLDVLEAEVVPAAGEASEVPSSVESRADPDPGPSRLSRFFSGGFSEALFLIGPLTAAAFLALVWALRGAAARVRAVPGRALRPRADRAVRRMAKALQAAPVDHPDRDEALRESDTALTVLGGETDELDLVGVTVLADRAVLRLGADPDAAARAAEPLCMINPLHGPAVRLEAVRKGRRTVVSRKPVCLHCSLLSEQQRRNRVLRVTGPEGGRVPYLELDREWNRSGYGIKYRLDVQELLKGSDVH